MTPPAPNHFEDHAAAWLAWSRTPGHDAYWDYSGPAFRALLPRPAGWTLDLGCGEGRLTRDLAGDGHRVVGIDPSPSLLWPARAAHHEGHYALASGETLPFAEETFGLVVAFNVLMDVADMPSVVQQAGRVLSRGGRFCVCVTHPINDAGTFTGEEPDAPFVVAESYFASAPFSVPVERNGLQFTFAGTSHPLESYAVALETAGLLVESLREPMPPESYLDRHPAYRRWARIPMFLMLRAVKP